MVSYYVYIVPHGHGDRGRDNMKAQVHIKDTIPPRVEVRHILSLSIASQIRPCVDDRDGFFQGGDFAVRKSDAQVVTGLY